MAHSVRSYARFRGCSPESVRRAINGARLVKSVEWHDGSPQIRDFALADREWEANTDLNKRPIAIQVRDEWRARELRRLAQADDPIPFERFSVMRTDDDEVGVCDIEAPDDSSDGYCMSRDTARKLAAALLQAAGPEAPAPVKKGRRART